MLLIDAGNTFIKWAMADARRSFTLDSIHWKDFGAVRHRDLGSLKDTWKNLHKTSPIDHVLISNVAGDTLGKTLSGFLSSLVADPSHIEWFHSEPKLGDVVNTYRDSHKLGCDRFASLIGAHTLLPNRPLVVVTAGTATTIDTLSPDGTFLGGMIVPGLKLMAESLAKNTALLPDITKLDSNSSIFADNTGSAILSGCLNAQAGAIERAMRIHGQKFSDVMCLLSGGAARYIAPSLSIPFRIIDNLVLIGLHSTSVQQTS